MRYITIPKPIDLKTIDDSAVVDSDGEPMVLDLFEYIRARLVDPKFTGDKKGYEAAMFMAECKAELDRQKAIEGLKVMKLETEFWKRLEAVTKEPTGAFDPRWAHSMVPIMKAVVEASDKDPQATPDLAAPAS